MQYRIYGSGAYGVKALDRIANGNIELECEASELAGSEDIITRDMQLNVDIKI